VKTAAVGPSKKAIREEVFTVKYVRGAVGDPPRGRIGTKNPEERKEVPFLYYLLSFLVLKNRQGGWEMHTRGPGEKERGPYTLTRVSMGPWSVFY